MIYWHSIFTKDGEFQTAYQVEESKFRSGFKEHLCFDIVGAKSESLQDKPIVIDYCHDILKASKPPENIHDDSQDGLMPIEKVDEDIGEDSKFNYHRYCQLAGVTPIPFRSVI